MKSNIKIRWDLNKASFLLVVLPYIGFNWRELYESIFFNLKDATIIFLVLILIEIIYKQTVKRFDKYEPIISVSFICFTILFFYGNIIVMPIYKYLTNNLHFIIYEKILFLLITIILIILFYYLFVKKKLWKVFNIFLIIYFIVNIFSPKNLFTSNIPPINSIQNGYKYLQHSSSNDKEKYKKPILLIILDEYSSPDEIYKIVKDSSIYNFSNSLQSKGWVVRNSSYTFEKSTIHSISSLINYNLSKDSLYENQKLIGNIVKNKMIKNFLLDSLSKKGVSFNNFGIFHIGNTKPLSRLYLYPTNFIERFLIRTTYAEEKNKSNNFKLNNLIKRSENIFEHNNFILYKIPSIIKRYQNQKSLTYIHLYMPHAPFYFGKEFANNQVIDFNHYFLFWKFTNNKIEALLDSINKQGEFRIILTGDHGFRRNEHKENYHNTFTAFKGFDTLALKQIESVQDLGILINGSF